MEDNKLADFAHLVQLLLPFQGVKLLESHSVHMDYTKKGLVHRFGFYFLSHYHSLGF